MRRRSIALGVLAALGTAACGLVLALPDATSIAGEAGVASQLDAAATEAGSSDTDVTVPEASPCGADVSNDALHCGACGRSCLGAKCESGQCAPLKLGDANEPVAMTFDQEFVYWLESGSGIHRAPKAGGAKQLVAQTGGPLVISLATDGAQVFWIEGSVARLLGCPRDGCPDSGPNALLSNDDLSALTVADGKLYAISDDTYIDFVWHVPLDGGPAEILRDAGGTRLRVNANNELVRGDTDIRKGLASAGAVEQYVGAFIGGLTGLSSDATWVAWSESFEDGGGTVRWSSGANPLVARGAWPSSVAIDNGYVYWTNRGEPRDARAGSVVACPLQGCPPEGPRVVVGPLLLPGTIAIDATHVYYTTGGSLGVGAVWRVPKL